MNITIETSEGKALVRLDGILDSYIAEEITSVSAPPEKYETQWV